MEPIREIFDFQNSRNNPPPLPISQSKDLTLYTQQEREEHLGNLLFADPDFIPLIRPTTLPATKSTPTTPSQVVKTIYPNIKDPSTPRPNLHQSLPAHLTTHGKTIFPRPSTLFFQIPPLDYL